MVINALKKAFKTAKPVILNSDQGCQFTSNEYMNFLKENQIRQSMDGKSRWADNIMIERWFRSFKYEEAYLTQYANIREARKAIGKYIHTYNFERCHSAINNIQLGGVGGKNIVLNNYRGSGLMVKRNKSMSFRADIQRRAEEFYIL